MSISNKNVHVPGYSRKNALHFHGDIKPELMDIELYREIVIFPDMEEDHMHVDKPVNFVSENIKKSRNTNLTKEKSLGCNSEKKALKRKATTADEKQESNMKKYKRQDEELNNVVDSLFVKKNEQETTVISESERMKKPRLHPNTATMVMESIKALNKRNGVSLQNICDHIEETYVVNMKRLKSYIVKFLQKCVEDGEIENTETADNEERFKMKKTGVIKNAKKNLPQKAGQGKPKMQV